MLGRYNRSKIKFKAEVCNECRILHQSIIIINSILIMSISGLYIQKHIEKDDAIVFQDLLEGSLSFMLSEASLKSQRPGYCQAKGRHPSRDPQLDALAFQGLLEGSLAFMLLSAKGRYRKKSFSNFENSNQLKRKLGSFFIRLLYSVNS